MPETPEPMDWETLAESPPATQYHVRSATTVREITDAMLSVAGEIVGRTPSLQSPLVATIDDAGDIDYLPASGASKPPSPERTEHRAATRVTRSRNGRTSYVVTAATRHATMVGEIPDGVDIDRCTRLDDWREGTDMRNRPIVRMSRTDLIALADTYDGVPALIGRAEGKRTNFAFETERLTRERPPHRDLATMHAMTPRDVDNPSIARWSGDALAWFPEIRERRIVAGDESTWADVMEGNARHYNRPPERRRGRLSIPLGKLRDGETDRITDGSTVHLVAASANPERAFIGHLAYDRPATVATARELARAERPDYSPETIALCDEIFGHLDSCLSQSERSGAEPTTTWLHHERWTVTARFSPNQSRWGVTVYHRDTHERAASFQARSARAIALRLETL